MANPASSVLLAHRGVEAWLTNSRSHSIPHGPSTVKGNKITAPVQASEKTDYRIRWRSIPDHPLTALCNIIAPSPHRRNIVVATHFMDENDLETQYLTCKTCLSGKEGWLRIPPAGEKGFVELHIRRAKPKSPLTPQLPQETDDSAEEPYRDLIDDEDSPPFMIFRFEFVGPPKRRRTPEATPSPQKRQRTAGTADKPAQNLQISNKPTKTSTKPLKPYGKPDKTPQKTAVSGTSNARASAIEGSNSIMDKLIVAKAEAVQLDFELQRQLSEVEKSNNAKRKLLGK